MTPTVISDGAFLQQVMRFVLFSGTAAVVNLATGYLLYEILGFSAGFLYGLSVAVAFLAGMVVSYLLNRRYTFELAGRRVRDEMRTFMLVSVGGLLLTVGLSSLFRSLLFPWLLSMLFRDQWPPAGINLEMISHIAAVGLVAIYSFWGHKHVSFGMGIRHSVKRVAIGRGRFNE